MDLAAACVFAHKAAGVNSGILQGEVELGRICRAVADRAAVGAHQAAHIHLAVLVDVQRALGACNVVARDRAVGDPALVLACQDTKGDIAQVLAFDVVAHTVLVGFSWAVVDAQHGVSNLTAAAHAPKHTRKLLIGSGGKAHVGDLVVVAIVDVFKRHACTGPYGGLRYAVTVLRRAKRGVGAPLVLFVIYVATLGKADLLALGNAAFCDLKVPVIVSAQVPQLARCADLDQRIIADNREITLAGKLFDRLGKMRIESIVDGVCGSTRLLVRDLRLEVVAVVVDRCGVDDILVKRIDHVLDAIGTGHRIASGGIWIDGHRAYSAASIGIGYRNGDLGCRLLVLQVDNAVAVTNNMDGAVVI